MSILSLIMALQVAANEPHGPKGPAPKSCQPEIVAVIDTGFGYSPRTATSPQKLIWDERLCKNIEHKDFSNDHALASVNVRYPLDINGHGTNVIGLIERYAEKGIANYCILVVKYYSDKQTGLENAAASLKAIKYAIDSGANIINYSGGGPNKDPSEVRLVRKFLDAGGIFIAAAGNDDKNIGLPGNAYYPAMDDPRVTVVANMRATAFFEKSSTSNYGTPVKYWEIGENQTAFGITMTGTSQATAIHTGKILADTPSNCDQGR